MLYLFSDCLHIPQYLVIWLFLHVYYVILIVAFALMIHLVLEKKVFLCCIFMVGYYSQWLGLSMFLNF